MQGVSFPDINKTPPVQSDRATVPEYADPWSFLRYRAPSIQDDRMPDTSASGAVLQVLRWLVQEPDVHRRGSADAWIGRKRSTRRSRPRSSTSSIAMTRRRPINRFCLVQSCAHARHHRAVDKYTAMVGEPGGKDWGDQ